MRLTSPHVASRLVRVAYQSDRTFSELAAFVAVVEHRGFSSAARAAGLRKATLSERVRSLEERLGVRLLVRTTRTLRLTDEGHAYAVHARRSLEAARDAETAAVATRATPSGTLRVSMSPALATVLLDGVVTPYMRAHPRVSVEVDASTRNVDLAREGFDLAVRVGRLADSALTVHRLGGARGGYYAGRTYVARRGMPKRPEDIAEHDAIAMPRGDRMPRWHFAAGNRKRAIIVRPRLFVASFELGIRAALAGLGIVPNLHHYVRPYLARKQLVAVLEEWTPPALEVNAVFAPGSTLVPKTRTMIDMLAAWFAARGGCV